MAMLKTIRQILNMGQRTPEFTLKEIQAIDTRLADVEAGSGSAQYFMVPLNTSAAKTDITPVIFQAPVAGSIEGLTLIPNGALAQSDTDYLTLKAIKGGATDICTAKTTKTTGGVALAENTAITFAMLAAKAVAANDVVEFSSANTGTTGAAFPGGAVLIKFVPS